MALPTSELHIISTGKQTMDHFAAIAAKIHPFVDAFHLREKSRSAKELLEGVRLLIKLGVPLTKIYLNDRVDVAWAVQTGGIHLAFHSLDVDLVRQAFPGLRVGRSVHSLEEARLIERQGADYVVFGHIFPTASKPDLPAKGIAALARTAEQLKIPVMAIGGIKPDNVRQVLSSGAAGIAVMSGVLEADDPLRAVKAYRDFL